MKKKTKRYIAFFAFIIGIIAAIILISLVKPTEIVDKIGVQNSYLALFIVASLGGVSSITSSSLFIFLSILAAGGLSPLLLGLVGGIGASIGDSLFFYIGTKAENIAPEKMSKKSEKISKIIQSKPKWVVPIMVYLYAGFAPLPNDIMTVPLGFFKYKYKKIIAPLILGNITYTILFSYAAKYGINLFF